MGKKNRESDSELFAALARAKALLYVCPITLDPASGYEKARVEEMQSFAMSVYRDFVKSIDEKDGGCVNYYDVEDVEDVEEEE